MTNSKKIFDSWLVMECQAGNKKAVTLLVRRWHGKLCQQAFWYTHDMDQAKDIVQDSWSVILKKLHQLKDPNSFGGWALKIVTRKTIDKLRKEKKELKNLEEHYDAFDSTNNDYNDLHSDDVLSRLRKSIKELPNHQQQVLNLFYLEEFRIKEIGEILHISAGTVKSRLFTAREKLKSILKDGNHEK